MPYAICDMQIGIVPSCSRHLLHQRTIHTWTDSASQFSRADRCALHDKDGADTATHRCGGFRIRRGLHSAVELTKSKSQSMSRKTMQRRSQMTALLPNPIQSNPITAARLPIPYLCVLPLPISAVTFFPDCRSLPLSSTDSILVHLHLHDQDRHEKK